ncbi:hypothetical protein KKG05_06290 [bacterium]|nr:hypothetical protein [bacterium]
MTVASEKISRRLFWIAFFSIAMAVVEAAIVVYLRKLYYPEGFGFPLKPIDLSTYLIELAREAATVVMLCAVGALVGKVFWEKFAYFLIAFGVWDIAYYIWLKVFLNWPASLLDWDILFLIPLPWIGPVIAPVSIAVIMIGVGVAISRRYARGLSFHATRLAWILVVIATGILLYSFMCDLPAMLHFQQPKSYLYGFLFVGDVLYIIAYLHCHIHSRRSI